MLGNSQLTDLYTIHCLSNICINIIWKTESGKKLKEEYGVVVRHEKCLHI